MNLRVENVDYGDTQINDRDYQDNFNQDQPYINNQNAYQNKNINQRNNYGADQTDQYSSQFQRGNVNINSSMGTSNYRGQNQNNFQTQNLRPDTGNKLIHDKNQKSFGRTQQKGKKKNHAASQFQDKEEIDEADEKMRKNQGCVIREMKDKKSFKRNQFRDLCFEFQLLGANFKLVTNNLSDKQYDTYDSNKLKEQICTNINQDKISFISDLILTSLIDFQISRSKKVRIIKWLERLYFETEKFFLMQRMFLLIQRKVNRQNTTFSQLLNEKYKLKISKEGKISAIDFCKILERFGVLRSDFIEDQRIIIDEYGIVDEEAQKELNQLEINQNVKLTDNKEANDQENQNDVKDQKNDENLQQAILELEKKRIQSTYFIFDEIFEDYQYFQYQVFPRIDQKVLELIFTYCEQSDKSLREVFFSNKENEEYFEESEEENEDQQQIQQNVIKDSRINRANSIKNELVKYKSFIDDLDLYYISDQVKKPYYGNDDDQSRSFEDNNNATDYDYFKIFQIFALKAAYSLNERKIQFAYIYQLILKDDIQQMLQEYPAEIHQSIQELESQTAEDMKQQLLRFLANDLYSQKKKIDIYQIFYNKQQFTTDVLFQTLKENFKMSKFPLFSIQTLELICLHFYKYQQERNNNQRSKFLKNFEIQQDLFIKNIKHELNLLLMRESIIEKFSGYLRSQGFTYESMFQRILGIKNIEKALISKEQLYQAFELLEFKISQEDYLLFFSTFTEYAIDEEIQINYIIQQAKQIELEYLSTKKNKAKRRYQGNINEILEFIGDKIQINKLKDFGSIIKGQDFQDNGYIKNDDFFQTLQSIAEFVQGPYCLQNGDIMDLINELDEEHQGFINLENIKSRFDMFIKDSRYYLVLQSKIKEVCDNQILEQNIESSPSKILGRKSLGNKLEQIVKPKHLNLIVIDIFCGLQNIQKSMDSYFDNYSFQGKISQDDFQSALQDLNVQIDQRFTNFSVIFQYFIELQIKLQGNNEADLTDYREQLELQFLQEQLVLEIKRKNNPKELKSTLLEEIVMIISKETVPILEIVESIKQSNEQDDMQNLLSLEDFKTKILQDYFKLSQLMTDNKIEFLSEPYIDPDNIEFVEIDRFINDLHNAAFQLNKRGLKVQIFQYQYEIEEQLQNQKQLKEQQKQEQPQIKIKKGNFVEPVYILRSEFNTYLTSEEYQKLGNSLISPQSTCAPNMQDIMLRTRAMGKTVEEYFKYFGQKMPNGLTELTPDQFKLAIKNIGLPWSNDLYILNLVVNTLDQDQDKQERGTIDMQEIGKGILGSQIKKIQDFEDEYLEKLYNHMCQNNQLGLMKELLTIFNFNNDYSCSPEQFKQLFHDNLRVPEGCLEDWQISILLYRYSFKIQDNQILRISFIQLFVELLERKMGFKFEEQNIIKMSQTFLMCIQCNTKDLQSIEKFLSLKGDTRQDQISEKTFMKATEDIKFDLIYSKDQIKKFLFQISKQQNSQIQQHQLSQIIKNLQKYCYVNPNQLFQNVLNKIFIQSKRIKLKQNALTIFTDVDLLDNRKDGFISVEQFVTCVKKITGISYIRDLDLEYLSIKYRNMNSQSKEDSDKVFYKFFYNDYQELQEKGLQQFIIGLDELDNIEQVQAKDPFDIPIPSKFLIFYEGIQQWIIKKDPLLADKFCTILVEKDTKKEGFLNNKQFDESFQKIGMPLSKKQVGQATYCLHQDDQGRFSYHELINHIFGQGKLLDIKYRFNLQSNYIENLSNKSAKEFEQMQLSDILLNQMSFKYSELLLNQKQISEGSNMLLESEFFKCFEESQIILSKNDKNALSIYFKVNQKRLNKTISFQDVFIFYNIGDRLEKLFKAILEYFRNVGDHSKANQALQAQQYYFTDLLTFIQRAEFDTTLFDENIINQSQKLVIQDKKTQDPRKQFKNLLDLFDVLREDKPFLQKEQILSLFEIKQMDANVQQNESNILKKQKKGTQEKSLLQKQQEQAKIESTIKSFEKFVTNDKVKIKKIQDIKDQFISLDDFRKLISALKFKSDDFQAQEFVVNKFIDQKQRQISIIKLKMFLDIPLEKSVSIKKIRKQNSIEKEQKNKQVEKEEKLEKQELVFNQQTNDLLVSVQLFLKQNNKTDLKKLFKEMDQNGNNQVNQKEFIEYFLKLKDKQNNKQPSEVDKKINQANLQTLFQALDQNNSNNLDLNELKTFLNHVEQVQKQIQNNVSSEADQILDVDIERLFRRVDTDHNGTVDAEELYQLLKPLRPGKISLKEVQSIIKRFDKNNDAFLGPEEFQTVVKEEIIKDITSTSQNFENFKLMFKSKDLDNDGQLTVQEFKDIVFNQLKVKNMQNKEIQSLIQFLDQDGDQLIKIDDFFILIQNQGKLKFLDNNNSDDQIQQNANIQKCLFEIRKSMSLNLFELFSFFVEQQLPNFFEPSFLQGFLEKEHKNMPSQGIISDKVNIDKSLDLDDQNIEKKLVVSSKQCFKIKLLDIEHVPIPISMGAGKKNVISLDDIIKREVRIILFDTERNVYISNIYIIPAYASPNGQSWTFKQFASIELATEFTFKYEQSNLQDIQIIFELVITIKQSKNANLQDQNIQQYQVTNGWGFLSLISLQLQQNNLQVKLLGGSPSNLLDIDKKQVQNKEQKKKGALSGLFNKKKDNEEEFFLTIQGSYLEPSKLLLNDKLYYYYLPQRFIINTSLLGMVSALQIHNQSLSQTDFIISQTMKALDQTDINILMSKFWKDYFSLESLNLDKGVTIKEKVQKLLKSLKIFINEIYLNVLQNKEFDFDKIYTTRPSSLISPQGFQMVENKFNMAILNNIIDGPALQDNEKQNKFAKSVLQNCIKKQEEIKQQLKLIPQKPKSTLQGEGIEFYQSGLELFQLNTSIDNNQNINFSNIDQLLKKNLGKIDIIQ